MSGADISFTTSRLFPAHSLTNTLETALPALGAGSQAGTLRVSRSLTMLYFGTFDGKVLKAEASEADRDSAIPYSLMTSYNYFGDRERQKHFKLVRPILTANNDLTVGLAMSTDRSAVNDLDTVTIEAVGGSEWDSFAWDTTPWAGDLVANNDWYAVNGIGRAGALMMAGSAKDVSFNISAFHVTFDTGGLL
jgi:hypothetical protein